MRGARQMALEDVDVVRIEQRVFVGAAQEIGGMAHVVLVERVVEADQHGERGIIAAARAPGLLPQAGDGAGIADQQRRVQPAHVDPQLQRGGRRHAQQPAAEQLPLDAPALLRQVAGPIRRDAFRQPGRRLVAPQRVASIAQQQFGDDARSGERDGAHSRADQRREQLAGFMVGAAPGGVAAIEKRRIPQRKGSRPVRRAVIGDHDRRQPRQQLEVLGRVGDGGGGGDEDDGRRDD